MTCFIYRASNVAPEEIVWYCKVRRAGGPGDVAGTRNESDQEYCPEDLHGNLCCVSSWFILLEPQDILLMWMKLTAQKCFQLNFVPLCIHSDCTPLRILKEIWTNNAMSGNCTTHCHFCTMQRMLVKFMWVVWSPVATIMFIYTTRHIEGSLIWQ